MPQETVSIWTWMEEHEKCNLLILIPKRNEIIITRFAKHKTKKVKIEIQIQNDYAPLISWSFKRIAQFIIDCFLEKRSCVWTHIYVK